MEVFHPDRYYRPNDPKMRIIGTVGSLALQRHEGRGPPFYKLGARIFYKGADLNAYIEERRVDPSAA